MDTDISGGSSADGRDAQTFAIIGAAMDVHTELGPGFLEAVYCNALTIELAERNIPFEREVPLAVSYKGRPLGCAYKADFICHGPIIVELKASARLTSVDQAQLLNYLKATRLRRGLLLNFGTPRVETKRLVL